MQWKGKLDGFFYLFHIQLMTALFDFQEDHSLNYLPLNIGPRVSSKKSGAADTVISIHIQY